MCGCGSGDRRLSAELATSLGGGFTAEGRGVSQREGEESGGLLSEVMVALRWGQTGMSVLLKRLFPRGSLWP